MQNTIIKISEETKLILSHKGCGYQEVLDSLDSANMVRISTYNISNKNNKLLQMIEDLSPEVDVKIITNIPNRFANYYTPKAKNNAKQTINSYMDKLNPEKYSADLSTFFNFENHSKIIMTDTIAYIGSANFSNESNNNWECGVLIKERKIIDQIEKDFFSSLQENSIIFRGTEIRKLYIYACEILSRLELVTINIRWSMYTERDLPFSGIQYKAYAPELSNTDLINLETIITDFDQLIADLDKYENYSSFAQMINEDLLSFVNDLIATDTLIYLLANFDEQKSAEDYMEKYGAWADEEHIDECASQASQSTGDELADLAMQAKDDVDNLLSTLDILINDTINMIGSIGSCDEQALIDNT